MINEKGWIDWLKAKGLSDKTIKNYCFYFEKFNWSKLDHDYLVWFVKRYNNKVARAFLKSAFHYIKTGDFADKIKELINSLEIPKFTGMKKQRIINVLSKEEVLSIANVMKNKRNKIMVLLTYFASLRITELISIRPYDFNWDVWLKDVEGRGKLKVIGKGDKQREITIIPDLMNVIHLWIKEEISQKQDKNDLLFKIKQRRWQIILEKASKESIGRRVNPHLLRHSSASFLFEKGLDIMEIKEHLGHQNISTTQIYLHINKKKLGEKIEKAFTLE